MASYGDQQSQFLSGQDRFAETPQRSNDRLFENSYGQSNGIGSFNSSAGYRSGNVNDNLGEGGFRSPGSGTGSGSGSGIFHSLNSATASSDQQLKILAEKQILMSSQMSSPHYQESQIMDQDIARNAQNFQHLVTSRYNPHSATTSATSLESGNMYGDHSAGVFEVARGAIQDYEAQQNRSTRNPDAQLQDVNRRHESKRPGDQYSSRSPQRDDRYPSSNHYGDGREEAFSSRSRDYDNSDLRSGQRNRSIRADDGAYNDDRSRFSGSRERDREQRSSADNSMPRRRDRDDQGRRDHDVRRRRSRSRSRDRHSRSREPGRDRRHRHSDRDRSRRDRHRDTDRDHRRKDDSPAKEVPWVPPPLPVHLRHVPLVLPAQALHQQTPNYHMAQLMAQSTGSGSTPWAPRHTPRASTTTRVAPPPQQLQNQFQNDGSFMERFRQKMQGQKKSEVEVSNVSDATLTAQACSQASASVSPSLAAALPSSGMPVIAKRRISKILKTGVVRKNKFPADIAGPEGNSSDAWSRYMSEVQKYRANKCLEDETSRPLMK